MIWLVVTISDWRDWRTSDQWVATESTTLAMNDKSSWVIYTYEVDGQIYENDRTHFFMAARDADNRHLSWMHDNRYAEATTVYYNPDDPKRSVLVREVTNTWMWRVPMTWGIACLYIMAPILFFAGVWWYFIRQFADLKN